MKKFLTLSILFVAMFTMFVSCTPNTPTGVAEKSISYLQSKDYKAYVNLMDMSKVDPDMVDQQKSMMISSLQSSKKSKYNKTITSYKTTEEVVSEDGKSADVKIEITYEDGSTRNESVDLVNVDGKWKLVGGK